MAIIISQKGGKAQKIDKTLFESEDYLQRFIDENPEAIPLYEIEEDIKLLVLSREFPTASGPIDALGVDREGEIYLVETKLYKNPDKRLVVAQVLDYGASLWASRQGFENFFEILERKAKEKHSQSINERLKEFFVLNDEEVELLIQNIKANLNKGNFRFVVLMDKLHSALKDLILFINQNSRFDLYAVELEYYEHENFEILIPKLFGAEVKKNSNIAAKPLIPSDDDFLKHFSEKKYKVNIREFLNFFNAIATGQKNVNNVSTKRSFKSISLSVSLKDSEKLILSLYIDPQYEGGGIQFWCGKKNEHKIRGLIVKYLTGVRTFPLLNGLYGKIARWPLEDFSVQQFEEFLKALT